MLKSEKEVVVRFNEVDSLGIVWHGHYVTYFEDGREDFGRKHELDYLKIYGEGYLVPIVSVKVDYKKTLAYGDVMIIETIYRETPAAKIIFQFNIYKKTAEGRELVATGETIQVFLDKQFNLQLYCPPFFESWKEKMKITNA